jgi:hypothetical protein
MPRRLAPGLSWREKLSRQRSAIGAAKIRQNTSVVGSTTHRQISAAIPLITAVLMRLLYTYSNHARSVTLRKLPSAGQHRRF